MAGRTVQRLLYGTQAVDPLVILMVTGLFLLSAAAAAFLPARRAASVDPMKPCGRSKDPCRPAPQN